MANWKLISQKWLKLQRETFSTEFIKFEAIFRLKIFVNGRIIYSYSEPDLIILFFLLIDQIIYFMATFKARIYYSPNMVKVFSLRSLQLWFLWSRCSSMSAQWYCFTWIRRRNAKNALSDYFRSTIKIVSIHLRITIAWRKNIKKWMDTKA